MSLIKQSIEEFTKLMERPPTDPVEWNERQRAAAKPLDDAHTLWMNMSGRDQAEVRNAWAAAEVEIEKLLSRPEVSEDAEDDTDEDDGYEPDEFDDEFDADLEDAE